MSWQLSKCQPQSSHTIMGSYHQLLTAAPHHRSKIRIYGQKDRDFLIPCPFSMPEIPVQNYEK